MPITDMRARTSFSHGVTLGYNQPITSPQWIGLDGARPAMNAVLEGKVMEGWIIDYTATQMQLVAQGVINHPSNLWRVEAMGTKGADATSWGVCLSNNIGGKGGTSGTFYSLELPENYTGEVNIQKVNQDNNKKDGATFTAYASLADAQKAIMGQSVTALGNLTPVAGSVGLSHFEISWPQEEGTTKTVYITETGIPAYYDFERKPSGTERVIHQVTFDGEKDSGVVGATTVVDYYFKETISNGQITALTAAGSATNTTLDNNTLTFSVKDESNLYTSLTLTKKDNGGNIVAGAEFYVGTGYTIDAQNNASVTGSTFKMNESNGTHTWTSAKRDYDGTDACLTRVWYIVETKVPANSASGESYQVERGSDGKQVVIRVTDNNKTNVQTWEKLVNGTWTVMDEKSAVNRALISYSTEKTFDTTDTKNKTTSVTVELLRNGTAVAGSSVTLDSTNGWKHTWTGLDEFDSNGNKYTYSQRETHVNGTPITDTSFESVVVGNSIKNYLPKTSATLTVGKILSNRNFQDDDKFTIKVTPLTTSDPQNLNEREE